MTNTSRPKHLSASPFVVPPEAVHPEYAIGDRVIHDTYGLGRVIGLEGTRAVSVDFGRFTRRVPLPASRMTAL
jgi:hypothetical protein